MHFGSLIKFLALIAILAPAQALAWGAAGHEIAAAIALRELTPAARDEVGRLLGSPVMMVHDASWADEIRDSRPETGAWHYVDIPLRAGGYDGSRDCGDGDCVVAQIGDDLRILSNRHAPDAARAEALRFLIHFVADVHQPLHAEDNDDKGGNQVHLRLGRERASLHKLWDVDVVEPLGPDPDTIAENIEHDLPAGRRQEWQSGSPARWANEAHAIAREHIYPPLGGGRDLRLPRDYAFREAPLARILLAKAGVRLAWLLNTALR
ncbi:MAG TPA: S1/P1 nuclease [Rhizomicrobium sp.]